MPPRNRKTQVRPVSWCGALSDEARAADAAYRQHLADLGLIERPWVPPPLPYYAHCLPDAERTDEP